ncbi:MAG: NAD-dependent protein deacylase [Bacteroidaceae bacterium]|nr:NAD-dependent protein deacylase [Bacteroidaceae bacterium]
MKIVVLTGAGMSVESGIATFRGGGGLWDNYPVERVASIDGYRADPALVLEFYNIRRKELLAVEPNEGHRLLASLEREHEVVIVTQNVDNLHERAGSSNVIHLHGELMKVCSSKDPYNEAYVEELTPDNIEISVGDCAGDGSQLRPFIVWFGEAVPRIEDAVKAMDGADLFVIIGTSLNVYPAAGLLSYVPAGTPVFLIDPNEVKLRDTHGVNVIHKGASEGVRVLMEEFLKIK